MEEYYSISIETSGSLLDDAAIEELAPILESFGAEGAVGASGGLAGGPGATFSLPASDPGSAVQRALGIFHSACEKLGIRHDGYARVDVMTEAYRDRWLEEEPDRYVGVSEIADLLGVSKQRVSELRAKPMFPEPVAELARDPCGRSRASFGSWSRGRGSLADRKRSLPSDKPMATG